MKRIFFALALTIISPIVAHCQVTARVTTIGTTHDTLKENTIKLQTVNVATQSDITIHVQYTRLTDSVNGSFRLYGSVTGATGSYAPIPGYENDTVIINRASINKMWVIRKSPCQYYQVQSRASSNVTHVGTGLLTTKLYQYEYKY